MTTHRESRTPLFKVWMSMLARCNRKTHQNYHNYGGRGIKVCDEWHDYVTFRDDMGHKPDKYTLERIDNDGNYEPSNCEWATMKQQCRNRRGNTLITHNGITLTQSGWAEKINISPDALSHRIRAGWSIEKALSTPKGQKRGKDGRFINV